MNTTRFRSLVFVRARTQEGFVTIWMLGLCFVILGLGGISLDMWRGFSEERELAAITDAAAVAAASHIDLDEFRRGTDEFRDKDNPKPLPLNESEARQTALAYLDREAAEAGFTYTGVDIVFIGNEIRVTASREINTTLLRMLVPGSTLEVRTTGAASPGLGT